MIRYPASYICSAFSQFSTSVQSLLLAEDPAVDLGPSFKEVYSRLHAFSILNDHRDIFLDENLSIRVWTLQSQLKGGEKFTAEGLARELQGLEAQMGMALSKRHFAYIPPPNDSYFEKEELFGEEVYRVFPKARTDIKEAGNAFAVSLYTACVFHLMRAAEHGLRRLAKKLRVIIKHTNTMIPLEYGEWDKIIIGINAQIAAARALPAGPKRQRSFEIYSDASQHCLFMKDIWRNTASHARKAYTHNEALAALERVRDFMQFLAKGMK